MTQDKSMAYDKQQLYDKAIELASDKALRLIWIEELVAHMGVDKTTFYKYFPLESNELNEIKAAIQNNKAQQKIELRNKWHESPNATLQLALYRLLSTPEEHALLNQTAPDRQAEDHPDVVGFEFKKV